MRFVIICLFLCLSLLSEAQQDFYDRLAESAFSLTKQKVEYDPAYYVIGYPNGDVPSDVGVCSDVIIRAYRMLGIDLQKEVHEDMVKNFQNYPHSWNLKSTDKNIDHRRVPNLMTFFARKGTVLKISGFHGDYQPGDIVCWDLGNGVKHIGIVANRRSPDQMRYMIVHNIGRGQVMEDCLFRFRIIGHFRYSGD